MPTLNKGPIPLHDQATAKAHSPSAYGHVREQTESLCAPLEAEDYVIQTCAEASPAKWHLAHTSWFFETFLLVPFLKGYRPFHPHYEYLFNSYYEQLNQPWPRAQRGLLSRPTVAEVYRYRAHVDEHMQLLLEGAAQPHAPEITRRLSIGLNHEQQHQELLLTDIKLNFSVNPVLPAYRDDLPEPLERPAPAMAWLYFPGGMCEIGHRGSGFAFDNECPRHRLYLRPFRLANRPVTNGEYLAFMRDNGYRNPAFWLADGWATVKRLGWNSPHYWKEIEGEWWNFTLAGLRKLDLEAPLSHVSYYEAQAYAAWCGARLPTEAEWEVASADLVIAGNFLESDYLQPVAPKAATGLLQMYGDVWEHTASAYQPYPGYRPDQGALGEYNGKFMCGQFVLRGGSCVTPSGHVRASYRNFFYPHERWQFQGLRLADDAE